MVNDYFRNSQKVKEEIESDPELIRDITDIFETRREDRILGNGSSSDVFYAGKTKSGLYVALRLTKERYFEMHGFNTDIVFGEIYCSVAGAFYIAHKKEPMWFPWRPVNFCVGVVYQDRIPGLLLEDISENRKYELEEFGSSFERMHKGKKVDTVLADLDGLDSLIHFEDEFKRYGIEIQRENPPYFSKENRINL